MLARVHDAPGKTRVTDEPQLEETKSPQAPPLETAPALCIGCPAGPPTPSQLSPRKTPLRTEKPHYEFFCPKSPKTRPVPTPQVAELH